MRSNGLTVTDTAPITATGTAPDQPAYQLPGEAGALLKSAFDMSADEDPVVETVAPGQRFPLMAVSRLVPAAAPPLAQVRERVKADLVARRAADRAKAVASSLVAKVNAGTPLRQAFAEARLPLPPVQPVSGRRLDIARQGAQVPPPLAMMFSLPKGKARLLPGPNGSGWFVVHLEQAVPGDIRNLPGLVEATRTQFSQVVGSEYAEQFSRAVEARMGVERDEKAIERLKSQMLRGAVQ